MTPQTVNAVNLPLQNALNFPAAILAPPFFDPAAPAAVNYGAIGSVIGHEISHSFDDQGALFDARVDWPIGGRKRISRTSRRRANNSPSNTISTRRYPT